MTDLLVTLNLFKLLCIIILLALAFWSIFAGLGILEFKGQKINRKHQNLSAAKVGWNPFFPWTEKLGNYVQSIRKLDCSFLYYLSIYRNAKHIYLRYFILCDTNVTDSDFANRETLSLISILFLLNKTTIPLGGKEIDDIFIEQTSNKTKFFPSLLYRCKWLFDIMMWNCPLCENVFPL